MEGLEAAYGGGKGQGGGAAEVVGGANLDIQAVGEDSGIACGDVKRDKR